MENFELIVSLASTAAGLLIVCVSFLVKLINSIKKRKSQQNEVTLLDAVAPIVEIAETFTNYSGEEKKEYVLTKVNQFAIENGIKFDSTLVSNQIERLIELSKQVNKRESN